jgi:hypothetical protein
VLAAHGTGIFEFAHGCAKTFHIRATLATRFFKPASRKVAKAQSKVFPLCAFAPLRETISAQKSVCIRARLWF